MDFWCWDGVLCLGVCVLVDGLKKLDKLLAVGGFHCASECFGGWVAQKHLGVFNGCPQEVNVVESGKGFLGEPHELIDDSRLS